MLTAEDIALLQEWHKASTTLKTWVEYEHEVRRKVVKRFGPSKDGSTSVDIGNGYKLGVVRSTRYKVDNTAEMRALVDKFIQFPDTQKVGTELLRWSPDLAVRAYRDLPDWGRAYFDKFVTSTPNAPQVTIKGP